MIFMNSIGFWSKNPRLGADAWINLSSYAKYNMVKIKGNRKTKYNVFMYLKKDVVKKSKDFSSFKKAHEHASEFMRRHPSG